jgi:endonuclease/exonuclease/phosphatase family metal-dependent hydrolase
MPEVTVANFNSHASMDGWGRPFDLVKACEELAADVIVLQEAFAPLRGMSQAEAAADAIGYKAFELPLARAARRQEPVVTGKGWGPRRILATTKPPMRVGGRLEHHGRPKGWEEGTWGLAILSRVPVLSTEAYELGKLKRDFTRRGVLMAELDLPAASNRHFAVIAMHAAHVTAGSHSQFRQLRTHLPPPSQPAAALGDMNLWGPPLSYLLPGWSRAVKGRTWPAWRPHSQIDHILVTEAVTVVSGEVLKVGNSDHLAVKARLRWGED